MNTETQTICSDDGWWAVQVRWVNGNEHGRWHTMGLVGSDDAQTLAEEWAKIIKDHVTWEEDDGI